MLSYLSHANEVLPHRSELLIVIHLIADLFSFYGLHHLIGRQSDQSTAGRRELSLSSPDRYPPMWLHVLTCKCKWLHVVTCGIM